MTVAVQMTGANGAVGALYRQLGLTIRGRPSVTSVPFGRPLDLAVTPLFGPGQRPLPGVRGLDGGDFADVTCDFEQPWNPGRRVARQTRLGWGVAALLISALDLRRDVHLRSQENVTRRRHDLGQHFG